MSDNTVILAVKIPKDIEIDKLHLIVLTPEFLSAINILLNSAEYYIDEGYPRDDRLESAIETVFTAISEANK